MIYEDLNERKVSDRLEVECDDCHGSFQRTKKNILASRRTHGIDRCVSCAAKASVTKKPQCSPAYWDDPERKAAHGETLKASEAYRHGIANRPDNSGINNPMFGTKHSTETRAKMSKSRTGKTGANATAWKGGKTSLNKRLKATLQRRHQWFSRVLARAEGICEHCGEKAVDAHHIVPMVNLIKSLLAETTLQTDDEKLIYLLEQDAIVDPELKNGLALCRPCHKKIHNRWGSKINP